MFAANSHHYTFAVKAAAKLAFQCPFAEAGDCCSDLLQCVNASLHPPTRPLYQAGVDLGELSTTVVQAAYDEPSMLGLGQQTVLTTTHCSGFRAQALNPARPRTNPGPRPCMLNSAHAPSVVLAAAHNSGFTQN